MAKEKDYLRYIIPFSKAITFQYFCVVWSNGYDKTSLQTSMPLFGHKLLRLDRNDLVFYKNTKPSTVHDWSTKWCIGGANV